MEDNKYQITKTVRFKLEPINKEEIEKEFKSRILQDCNLKIELSNFVKELDNFIDIISQIIYYKTKNGETNINNKINIRYDFLNAYFKQNIIEISKKEKIYAIKKLSFLIDQIQNSLEIVERLKQDIAFYSECDDFERKRKSEIAILLSKLANRYNIPFLIKFILSIDEKTAPSYIVNIITTFIKSNDIERNLKSIIGLYSPLQGSGILVATSSFNYYTINKTSKFYNENIEDGEYSFKSELQKAKDNNSKLLSEITNLSNLKDIQVYREIIKEKNDKKAVDFINILFSNFSEKILSTKYENLFSKKFTEIICEIYSKKATNDLKEILEKLTLEDGYQFIKFWKSTLKSCFYRRVDDYLATIEKEKENTSCTSHEENTIEESSFDILNELKSPKYSLYRMDENGLNYFIEKSKEIKKVVIIKNAIKEYLDNNSFKEESKILNCINELFPDENIEFAKNENNLDICDKKITDIAKERNVILVGDKNKDAKAQKFNNLTICFKAIAIAYGKNKAIIKAIEKEKSTSVQINYWSFITEKEGKKSLYLIPRNNDNIQIAHKEITEINETKDTTNCCTIHYFESLTLRALRKLCFNKINDNEFRNQLEKNGYKLPICEQKKKINNKTINRTDADIIKIYTKVLKTKSTISEQLKKYGIINKTNNENTQYLTQLQNCKTLADFETKLNLYCYSITKYISDDLDDFLQKKNIDYLKFDIEKYKNKLSNDYGKIWENFWDKNNAIYHYTTRLNPEIKIFKRDKWEDGSWETRFSKTRYTLAMTFIENADRTNIEYSFKENTKDKTDLNNKKINISNNILNFNNSLKSIYGNPKFSLGIDVGTNEKLASLSICDTIGNPIPIEVLITNNNFRNYSYIDKHGNERKFMSNPSFFLNKKLFEEYFKNDKFEEVVKRHFSITKVASIDLTTSKVFNIDENVVNILNPNNNYTQIKTGKVLILESDFITHLNLKKHDAQVRLFEKSEGKPISEFTLRSDEKRIYLDDNLDEKSNQSIYDYNSKYSCIQTNNDIFNKIHDCMDNPSKYMMINEINKERSAMVSNMVGTIYYLYNYLSNQKTTLGYITFEGLSKKTINSHKDAKTKSNRGDITIPLRLALLKKLQKDNLVPPYRELIKLTDCDKYEITGKTNDNKEYGIIAFVSDNKTSQICPKCNQSTLKHGIECNNCGFKPIGIYESFDCNDKIASFNIARRIFGKIKASDY